MYNKILVMYWKMYRDFIFLKSLANLLKIVVISCVSENTNFGLWILASNWKWWDLVFVGAGMYWNLINSYYFIQDADVYKPVFSI